MIDRDRQTFAAMICGVWELYGKVPTDAALEIYWMALRDNNLDEIELAIQRHLKDPENGKFAPLPAHLNKWLSSDKGAFVAWAEVEDAMVRYGAYRTVQFSNSVTNAVIRDLGGWPVVCREHAKEPWTEKEFAKRYGEYQACRRCYDGALPGIHETDNRAAGFLEAIPDPVYIGSGPQPPELGPHRNLRLLKPQHLEE